MNRAPLRATMCTLVACAAILALAAGAHTQPRYKITDLGVLPGSASTYPKAINERGQVAGVCSSTSGDDLVCGLGVAFKPFFYDGTRMVALPVLGDLPYATADGISASGQIVGCSSPFGGSALLWQGATRIGLPPGLTMPAGGRAAISRAGVLAYLYWKEVGGRGAYHTALLKDGKWMDLGEVPRSHGWTSAAAVNDSGDLVVHSYSRAYLFTEGKRVDMTALSGRAHVYVRGMNNRGEVVGHLSEGPGLFGMAFVYRSGKFVELGGLGGERSDAFGINDRGQIVGSATIPRVEGQSYPLDLERAFLCDGRWVVDLNTLIPKDSGWVLHQATGINNRGQICGVGVIGGKTRGFLLTPIAGR
jgi:probable HAF family extracellular repeat protein